MPVMKDSKLCSRGVDPAAKDGEHIYTFTPGARPDASEAYEVILSRIAGASAVLSPLITSRNEGIKCSLDPNNILPTKSVVLIPGVRFTTLKRFACLTKR